MPNEKVIQESFEELLESKREELSPKRFFSRLYNKIIYIQLEIKWGFQRMFRGWDDSTVWNLETHLAKYMPIWIKHIQESEAGFPGSFYPEGKQYQGEKEWNTTDEGMQIARENWAACLTEIIEGFEAADRIINVFDSFDKTKELEAVFEKGMRAFTRAYFGLWT